jgi:O-succinylbenzoic acid--CoA ligase
MNTFAEIQICGKTYGREWLLQHRDSLHELSLNETEQQTLEFCGRWLAEAREFEIKTSGTTGGIKSVKIKREQMIRSAEMTGQVLGLTPGDRALVCLSINYIAGVMMLVRGLVLGLTMVVVPPVRDPFVALGPDARDFEFASFVPLQLAALLSCRDYHPVLNRMKVVLVGGAAVSPSLLRRVRMLQVQIERRRNAGQLHTFTGRENHARRKWLSAH